MANFQTLTIDDTGFLNLPVGTTTQRPLVPETGMIRYNTSLERIEVYTGTAWVTTTN